MYSFSVIIPCKNEERYLPTCLNSLLAQKKDGYHIEIIVVDNGSSDNSLKILTEFSELVTVLEKPDLSIPDVRNCGARQANNEWIAFVDADVEVDVHWCRQIENSLQSLRRQDIDMKKVILGSTCSIPNNPTWVERVWFKQLKERDIQSDRYVNGANMVMHRDLFHRVGGFDHSFTTGEDEKICADVRSLGGNICKDDHIKAIHHGYPKTLFQFFMRERWHGIGMRLYLKSPWKSKDLALALYYAFILLSVPVLSAIHLGLFYSILLTMLFMLTPLAVFSYLRCGRRITTAAQLSLLYFAYGLARLVSLFDMLWSASRPVRRLKDIKL